MKRIPRKLLTPSPSPEATPPVPRSREEIIAATIEDAMRPYLHVLPPEGLESMRYALEDALTTHPVALEALEAMEPKPPVQRSGTRPRGEGGGDDGGAA